MHAKSSVPPSTGAPSLAAWDARAAHRERLVQAGQMLAAVVHEINNPLAVIQGYAQMLLDRSAQDDDRRDLQAILGETARLGALIEDMLAFTRRETDRIETVDLALAVASAMNLTAHAMRQARVTVVASLPHDELPVRGSHGALVQVLLNLLVNARHSLEAGGPREGRGIAVAAVLRPDGGLQLRVSNNGPPIPAQIAERIFEPFFTTKAGEGGSGLGLSLCRELLGRFGATIALEPTAAGRGPCFLLEFPST